VLKKKEMIQMRPFIKPLGDDLISKSRLSNNNNKNVHLKNQQQPDTLDKSQQAAAAILSNSKQNSK
jgi:hypothetical protein